MLTMIAALPIQRQLVHTHDWQETHLLLQRSRAGVYKCILYLVYAQLVLFFFAILII